MQLALGIFGLKEIAHRRNHNHRVILSLGILESFEFLHFVLALVELGNIFARVPGIFFLLLPGQGYFIDDARKTLLYIR